MLLFIDIYFYFILFYIYFSFYLNYLLATPFSYDLSRNAKYLLVAGFLASANDAKLDKRLYSTAANTKNTKIQIDKVNKKNK